MVIQATPYRLKTTYSPDVPLVVKPKVLPSPVQVPRPRRGSKGRLECPRCENNLMQG